MQYLLPLLAIFFWSGNQVVNKLSVGTIFPLEIGFYRWLLAALIITPFVLRPTLRNWSNIKPHLGKIFFLGCLAMALFQTLAYYAAETTSATNMSIIQALMPIMSISLAVLFLGQKLTKGALVGCIISFAGVLLVVTGGDIMSLAKQGIGMGNLLMIIAIFSYAVYSLLLKKWQIDIPAMQMLYLQILSGVIILLPLFLLADHKGLDSSNIPLVLYACIFASLAAPLLWMLAIQKLGPSRTSVFFNLMPIFTAIIAALILDEQLYGYHAIGGALTLLGVFLSEKWKTPLRNKPQAVPCAE